MANKSGRYDEERILESELVIQILEELNERDDYATSLANRLDSNQNTISEILTTLLENDLVEKTRRNRAQFYRTTDKGAEFIEKKMQIENKIENVRKELRDFLVEHKTSDKEVSQ